MILMLGDGILSSTIHSITGWNYISRKKDGIDFNDIDSYLKYISNNDVTEIINCIAYTKTKDNINKEMHWNTNYKSVMDLVDLCNFFEKKLIHISTDYVYANSVNMANEEDIPVHYNNWYVYTKILADAYIMARSNNYLILRASYKKYPFEYNAAWIDLIGNFDYVDVIANIMIELINKDCTGLFNVGTKLKTVYDLAKSSRQDIIPIHKNKEYIDSCNISMNLDKLNSVLGKK